MMMVTIIIVIVIIVVIIVVVINIALGESDDSWSSLTVKYCIMTMALMMRKFKILKKNGNYDDENGIEDNHDDDK